MADSSSNSPFRDDDEIFSMAYQEAQNIKEKALTSENDALKKLSPEDRYEINELLGEGAVKRVFLAYDRLIQREVAYAKIKEEHAERAEDLLTEVRIASKLEHPYIAPIYDMGYDESGLPYFVMKLYEGRSLDQELQIRRTTTQNSNAHLSWITQTLLKVCEALAFAHSKDVLHLDIKPSNIRIDDYGEVLLCDWGISNLIHEAHREDPSDSQNLLLEQVTLSRATLMGEIRGTPGFMAPEQIHKKNPCDKRTDVFGLGALLLDMLTGSPEQAEKPQDLYLRTLWAIAQKAKAPLSEERYHSIEAMMDDLKKYQSGLVTIAERASSLQIAKKWLQRHHTLVLVVSANLLLLCLGFLIYIYLIQNSHQKLERTLDLLHTEQDLKTKSMLELSNKYYKQGEDAFKGTVSKFDFDARDLHLSKEMMLMATQLNPNNLFARGLLGNIRMVNNEFKVALQDYELAGPLYKKHHNILAKYVDLLKQGDEQFLNIKLELIRELTSTKDMWLRNHMIFREIHEFHKFDTLLDFAIKAVAIVNQIEEVQSRYNPEKFSLDLSNNRIRTVYPLKTLPIKRLYLRHTNFSSGEIYNLRRMPLTHLDLSYSRVGNLEKLGNLGLTFISLEGTPVKNIGKLAETNVNHVNIAFTPAKLEPLKYCKYLNMVTCSIDQLDELRSLLGDDFHIKVIEKSL